MPQSREVKRQVLADMRQRQAAIAALALAQLRLQDQDHRIQCVILGRDLWTSSMSADRQRAMRLCTECPIQQECHDAAEARWEQRHIWGGRGFTRHPTDRDADPQPRNDRHEVTRG